MTHNFDDLQGCTDYLRTNYDPSMHYTVKRLGAIWFLNIRQRAEQKDLISSTP